MAEPLEHNVAQYMRSLRRQYPIPSHEEMLRLQAERDNHKKLELMVMGNIGLAYSFVRQNLPAGISKTSVVDLVHDCVPGLLEAAERWDPYSYPNPTTGEPGRFSTFARHWIRASFYRALPKYRNISLPSRIQKLYRLVTELNKAYLDEHNHAPSPEELRDLLNKEQKFRKKPYTTEEVTEIQGIYSKAFFPESLSKPLGDKEDLLLEDVLAHSDGEEIPLALLQGEQRQLFLEAIKALPEQEAKVITHLYGFGIEQASYRKIARELNMSVRKVRHYESLAVRRLKQDERVRAMNPYNKITIINTACGQIKVNI